MTTTAVRLLERWAAWAETQTTALPGAPDLRIYGSGYLHWGVQSNWNFAAAMATMATHSRGAVAENARAMAISALRAALATHVTGDRTCPDGKKWGHTWISMLGVERAMQGVASLRREGVASLRRGGVALLLPSLSVQDNTALRRVLVSEAEWLLNEARRGDYGGVCAGKWASSRMNVPESNIWSGAFLWRVAQMYPDELSADAWKERAHEYFINGASVEADADDDTVVAGKPVRERHVGANFFPHYALDHHGYMNVGYMVICASNAAILHFDAKRAGWERPESLDHHQRDLWNVLRRMVFADGRLARIGGDSRVRYAYCQEYLLPALLYAADRSQDPLALELAERQVAWIAREAESNADGSFYGNRLAHLRDTNPHYYCRLESDRAVVLAMLLNYLPLVSAPAPPAASFEESVAGDWVEHEHGAVLTRSRTRFASFSWRSHGLAQALCVPPGESSLAEWSRNLCPVVRFLGDDDIEGGRHRRLIRNIITTYPGGFVTCGSIMEGVEVSVDEGGRCTDQAVSHLAFAALPDGHTCVVIQHVVAAPDRLGYLTELKGLHLNVPNDLFNGYRRSFACESGALTLAAPAERDEVVADAGRWLNVDGVLGVVRIYGGDGLWLSRAKEPRGGRYRSLRVEEICTSVRTGVWRPEPGEVLIDTACAILPNVDAAGTAAFECEALAFGEPLVRGVRVKGQDGRGYAIVANFGDAEATVEVQGTPVNVGAGNAVMVVPAVGR